MSPSGPDLGKLRSAAVWILSCAGAVLQAGTGAGQSAWPWAPGSRPTSTASFGYVHPAVVRVMAADRDGVSLGSGTLVAANGSHGLVVTNWHVVREAAGPIVVAFPSGVRSPATVLKTDPEWDLAALAVWRPNVDPVPLANEPPRPGEPLTIAGYGSGQYRTITGRCTQYLAPGFNKPFEIVELSAPARQGDSGGPIFNGRGELAGVLFGTAGGQTSGSYCGRVRAFLASVRDDFFRLQPTAALAAQQPVPPPPPKSPAPETPAEANPPTRSAPSSVNPPPTGSLSSAPTAAEAALPTVAIRAGDGAWTSASPQPAGGDASATPASPDPARLPKVRWDDVKNYLAVIGVAAIVFQALKFLSGGRSARRRRRYYY